MPEALFDPSGKRLNPGDYFLCLPGGAWVGFYEDCVKLTPCSESKASTDSNDIEYRVARKSIPCMYSIPSDIRCAKSPVTPNSSNLAESIPD